MPPRAKQSAHGIVSQHIGSLIGVLGILFSLWVYQQSGVKEGGEILEFKSFQERLNADFRQTNQRQWDAINQHATDAEREHRELRIEIENDMRREIDLALRSQTTVKK